MMLIDFLLVSLFGFSVMLSMFVAIQGISRAFIRASIEIGEIGND